MESILSWEILKQEVPKQNQSIQSKHQSGANRIRKKRSICLTTEKKWKMKEKLRAEKKLSIKDKPKGARQRDRDTNLLLYSGESEMLPNIQREVG